MLVVRDVIFIAVSWMTAYIYFIGMRQTIESSNDAVMTMIRKRELKSTKEMELIICKEEQSIKKHLMSSSESDVDWGLLRRSAASATLDTTRLNQQLLSAIREANGKQALQFLKLGAKPIRQEGNDHNYSTLHICGSYFCTTSVSSYLGIKFGPDPLDTWGWSPLHVAASKGAIAAVAGFLSAGANPFLLNNDGWSPLLIANRTELPSTREVIFLIRTASAAHMKFNMFAPFLADDCLPLDLTLSHLFTSPHFSGLPSYAIQSARLSYSLAIDSNKRSEVISLFAAQFNPGQTQSSIQDKISEWCIAIKELT